MYSQHNKALTAKRPIVITDSIKICPLSVFQQNIAQSITLPSLACLLLIVHPGAMCSPDK